MIPVKQYDEAITSGNMETKTASIAMTAEIFELLSAGIYEDRLMAFVRELSTNASDAQLEVGKGDRAIEVHLPNNFEPFYYIRDFGTGLTKEQVFDMYLTYGESTKRDSNDFVGMLGVGSKSPLAYTDSFLVTSFKDGVESQYNIYKDNGIPHITELLSKPTEEENGLKITIAIRSQDFHNLRIKTATFFKLFPHEVEVHGAEINTEIKFSEQNDKYWLVESGYYGSGAYALMGGIPYRLSQDITESLKKDLKVDTIILPFEIGELTFASSRERLSFKEGDATDLAIKGRVKDIKKVFKDNMEKDLKSCATILEAVDKLRDTYGMKSTYYGGATSHDDIEWGGKTLKDWRKGLKTDDRFRYFKDGSDNTQRGLDLGIFNSYRTVIMNLVFFDADKKTANVKAVRKYSEEKPLSRVMFDLDQSEKDKLIEIYGPIETVKCSEVYDDLFPAGEKVARQYRKVSGVFLRSKDKLATREVTEVEGTEKGYYVDMVRDCVEINGKKLDKSKLHWLTNQGIIDNLYFIRKTSAKKNRPQGLIKLDDHIEGILKKQINKKEFKKMVIYRASLEIASLDIEEEYETLVDNGLLDLYPTLRFYRDRALVSRKGSSKLFSIARNAAELCGNSFDLSSKMDKAVERVVRRHEMEDRMIRERFPILFSAMASWKFEESAQKQVIEFVQSRL